MLSDSVAMSVPASGSMKIASSGLFRDSARRSRCAPHPGSGCGPDGFFAIWKESRMSRSAMTTGGMVRQSRIR